MRSKLVIYFIPPFKSLKELTGPNTTVYLQVIDPKYKKYVPKSLQTGLKKKVTIRKEIT